MSASAIKIITTLAGLGDVNYNRDNILATKASLRRPMDVAVDTSGDLYIADYENHRIRKVTKTTGLITTIAGTGQAGYNGDNIAATSALLYFPSAIAVDLTGDIYIADSKNNRVRKVSQTTGIITTFAGNGSRTFSGDNMQSTLSALNEPEGIAIDASRNIYISDSQNFRIRMVNTTTGIITTVAGGGLDTAENVLATDASLNQAHGVCVDAAGNLFIADTANNRIRMVNKKTGIMTTVAGTGSPQYNGDFIQATSASLHLPSDVAVDESGNLYIADTFSYRIRKVTKSTGIITTIVGTELGMGNPIEGEQATLTPIGGIYGITLDSLGDLYLADRDNCKIFHVNLWDTPTSMSSAVPTSMRSALPISMPSAVPTSMLNAVPSQTQVAGDGIDAFSGDDVLASSTRVTFASGICSNI